MRNFLLQNLRLDHPKSAARPRDEARHPFLPESSRKERKRKMKVQVPCLDSSIPLNDTCLQCLPGPHRDTSTDERVHRQRKA